MYLLDTSAVMAYYFNEPGADQVGEALATGRAWVAAVTWLELAIRLAGRSGQRETIELYRATLAGTVDITEAVAEAALSIRQASGGRVPAMNSLIAGAAKVKGFRLLHRDRHLALIPPGVLEQSILPPKN